MIVPHRGNAFRPHAFRHGSLSFYLFILMTFQVALGVTFYSGPEVKGVSTLQLKNEIIDITNQQRAKLGSEPLYESQTLSQAASKKLSDMFRKNYWDHSGPNGETAWQFITNEGYEYEIAGENLARGFSSSQSVVKAWMNSPTHKENLLNSRFQEIGVAVGTGKIHGATTTVIVQLFGRPSTEFIAPKTTATLGESATIIPDVSIENVTLPSKAPYFIVWTLIFGLIILDGIMLRKLGLDVSPKHLKSFRISIAMSIFMLAILSVGVAAII